MNKLNIAIKEKLEFHEKQLDNFKEAENFRQSLKKPNDKLVHALLEILEDLDDLHNRVAYYHKKLGSLQKRCVEIFQNLLKN